MSEHSQSGTSKADLVQIFSHIRNEVHHAQSTEQLQELYKRSGYMITMTHAAPIRSGVTDESRQRGVAEREFARTVHEINKRAEELGVETNYNENWEHLNTNGYETESGSLLEAENSGPPA